MNNIPDSGLVATRYQAITWNRDGQIADEYMILCFTWASMN